MKRDVVDRIESDLGLLQKYCGIGRENKGAWSVWRMIMLLSKKLPKVYLASVPESNLPILL
jgi:hypothetical protein